MYEYGTTFRLQTLLIWWRRYVKRRGQLDRFLCLRRAMPSTSYCQLMLFLYLGPFKNSCVHCTYNVVLQYSVRVCILVWYCTTCGHVRVFIYPQVLLSRPALWHMLGCCMRRISNGLWYSATVCGAIVLLWSE